MLKVVVVGNGMVGHHYVEQLVASEIEAQVTVIGGETGLDDDTLRANGLEPTELIAHISTRVIVNRASMKTRHGDIQGILDQLAEAVEARKAG